MLSDRSFNDVFLKSELNFGRVSIKEAFWNPSDD